MRIWLVVIPCAYAALLVVLAVPLIGVAFDVDYEDPDVGAQLAGALVNPDWGILPELVLNPWTYLWLGTLVGAQVALLLPCGILPGKYAICQ